MNCKNCGAPVPSSGVCEYCGTDYVNVRIKNEIASLLTDTGVPPTVAFEACGLFADPEVSFEIVKQYEYQHKPFYRDMEGRLCRNEPCSVVEKTTIKPKKKRIMR